MTLTIMNTTIHFSLGFHPFHVVSVSPWPILLSFSVPSFLVNSFNLFNSVTSLILPLFSVGGVLLILALWWRDVIRESNLNGDHSSHASKGLSIGIVIFILSEVMFFFSFFFGYFSLSLSPESEIGELWPPVGVTPLSFMDVPLLNTTLLLSSGVSVTFSHHSILQSDNNNAKLSLCLTVLLGGVFTFFQWVEYKESYFTMSDSAYGSLFFLITGFHGLHVLVGAFFLLSQLSRLDGLHFSSNTHQGFEFAAWYWHFVDVVWLLLFVVVYWWGS